MKQPVSKSSSVGVFFHQEVFVWAAALAMRNLHVLMFGLTIRRCRRCCTFDKVDDTLEGGLEEEVGGLATVVVKQGHQLTGVQLALQTGTFIGLK